MQNCHCCCVSVATAVIIVSTKREPSGLWGPKLPLRQRTELIVVPSPRVLGVDAFARRRGLTYAILLVDLERHQPVAILEGRMADPLI
jgi:hypothetical protein